MKKDSPFPTLQDWLAQLSDDQLAEILKNRPDTILPLPPGLGSLTARLELKASIKRALRTRSALELLILEAIATLGGELHPVTAPEILQYLSSVLSSDSLPSNNQVLEAISQLQSSALIYGAEELMIVSEVMSTLPAHWQLLPDTENRILGFDEATEAIQSLTPRHQRILDTLATSGGFGMTKDAALSADPSRPIPQLIQAGLLSRVDETTVKLPAIVRRILDGSPAIPIRVLPLPVNAPPGDDSAGIARGLEVLREIKTLIDVLSTQPVATLNEGGIGVRGISKLAKSLDVSPTEITRLISIGVSAGLFGIGVPNPLPTDDSGGNYLCVSALVDDWLGQDLNIQLATMLNGWWTSTFAPWLTGSTDNDGKVIHIGSVNSKISSLPESRTMIMQSLARVAPEEVTEDLFCYHPLASASISQSLISEVISEAQWIGAFAFGVTQAARALTNGNDPLEVIETPPTVDQFIVQSDLTILVPGPLNPEMYSTISQIADLESAGVASVYRLSEQSFRRALDNGLQASDISEFLNEHSSTPIPQSVGYLLDDVARNHGILRGGPALSYLRSDDPSLLQAVVSATSLSEELGIRLLAPTVAISQQPLIRVMSALRHHKFHPLAEDSNGAFLSVAAPPARIPTRESRIRSAGIDESRIHAAIANLRKTPVTAREIVPKQSMLTTLQAAIRGRRTVVLGFVDKHGVATQRALKPITISAGQIDAIDEKTGAAHRFMLHRITEVMVID